MAAQRLGFKMEDKFTLIAKARLISPNKYKSGQKHSRSYTSQFLVFIKDPKKKSKDFFFEDMLNRCEREEKENYVNVCFIIDQSGSMYGSEADVIGGFQKVIDEQRAVKEGKCTVSMFKFEDRVEECFVGKDVNEVG